MSPDICQRLFETQLSVRRRGATEALVSRLITCYATGGDRLVSFLSWHPVHALRRDRLPSLRPVARPTRSSTPVALDVPEPRRLVPRPVLRPLARDPRQTHHG